MSAQDIIRARAKELLESGKVATFIGWRLGGPVGLGTILCAFLTGPIMQLEFQLIKFEAEAVEHQNIVASIRVILSRRSGQAGTTD